MIEIGVEDVKRLLTEADAARVGRNWGDWYEARGIGYDAMDAIFNAVKSAVVEMLLRDNSPTSVAFEEFLTVFSIGWMMHEQYGRGR